MTRFTWPSPGQDESNITGSRLADQIRARVGSQLDGYAFATAQEAALAELLATTAQVLAARAFGAQGDGTTDDTEALQAALAAASAAGGGVVVLDPGTYPVSEMLVVSHKVQLRGSGGWDAVVIKASDSFVFDSTNNAVISIGEPDVIAFGSVVSDLMVNCNVVAASVGIYIASGNEASGCERVHVTRPMLYGIQVDAGNSAVSQNYFLRDISIGLSATATAATAVGLLISGGSADHRGIDGVTIDVSPSGSLGAGSIGLSLNGMGGLVSRVHVEDVETGIDIGPLQACTGLHVDGVTGHSTITDLVRINSATASQNVLLSALRKNNGTNIVTDEINSITRTSSDLALYAVGAGTPQPVLQAGSITGPFSVSGALTLASVLAFSTATTSTAGAQLWRSAANGLAMRGIAGSTYDWAVLNAGATAAVIGNLTGTNNIAIPGELQLSGALNHDGASVGFYGQTPTSQQTGVAVSAAAIHAALVNLGLITA